jgi:hypothetical protein
VSTSRKTFHRSGQHTLPKLKGKPFIEKISKPSIERKTEQQEDPTGALVQHKAARGEVVATGCLR